MIDVLSVLLSLIVILLCFFLGLIIISFIHPYKFRFTEIERFFSAIVTGILIFTWLTFLVSLIFSDMLRGIIVSLSFSFILLFIFHKRLFQDLKFNIRKISKISLVVIILLFLFSFFIVSASVLDVRKDGIYIGLNAWGDMALHLTIINSFSLADNFPPQYPVLSGHRMGYPCLFDFFSSILVKLGVNLRYSILIPTVIVMFSLFSLFYCLSLRFSKNRKIAIFALILLIFSGGLGFIYFLKNNTLSANSILQNNIDYTHNPELNLYLMNFTNNLIPQRTMLFGFALGLIIFIGLISYVNNKNKNKQESKESDKFLVFLGVLTGLLPLFHAHIYLSIIIFSASLFFVFGFPNIRETIKKAAYFFIPAIVLAIPQVLWMKSQIGRDFIQLNLGWMIEKLNIFKFICFWFMNLGIMLLLLILGFVVCNRKKRKIYLAFLSLFIIVNIIQFQPWIYDNQKILLVWLIGSVLLMAEALEWLWNKKNWKFTLILLIPLSIFSGILTTSFIINNQYILYTEDDIYIANWVNENIGKNAIFLTSDKHNHPVPMLAGRTVFEGYRGWLWTHGFDFRERDKITKNIYEARDKKEACILLKENLISYIFVGQSERDSKVFKLDEKSEQFFDKNFNKIFEYKDSKIYEVDCF